MHDIEPYYNWQDYYIASEDERSPFYGREYSEFYLQNKIYNYYIHPQWDEFGSSTLYAKILYVDYVENCAVIELIGEWNDALHNDIMYLKRELADSLIKEGIYKFILIGENVLNFHNSDDSYYEEWYDDIKDEDGWIVLINFLDHVLEEKNKARLYNYMIYGDRWNNVNWRSYTPSHFVEAVSALIINPKLLSEPKKWLNYHE